MDFEMKKRISEALDKIRQGDMSARGEVYNLTVNQVWPIIMEKSENSEEASSLVKELYDYAFANISTLKVDSMFVDWIIGMAETRLRQNANNSYNHNVSQPQIKLQEALPDMPESALSDPMTVARLVNPTMANPNMPGPVEKPKLGDRTGLMAGLIIATAAIFIAVVTIIMYVN
ncbi:MAG: hypothetical protein IJP13_01395 [Lachnospiraceae bacterium]|nr:hypothetical protein [Lachnospiraceae bacterium]